MAESQTRPVNIYLLGAGQSGKSSFIRRLVKDLNCQTVKLDKCCYATKLDLTKALGIPMLINIKEYRGVKHYGKLRFQYASADACLLFYDSNDRSSFFRACNVHWWCHYLMFGSPVTFLVGNKTDLFTNERIDKDYIDQFKAKYPRVKDHFEISTETGVNIRELFETVSKHLSQNDSTRARYSEISDPLLATDHPHLHITDLEPYENYGACPGICFIVNNNLFDTCDLNIRNGSEKDVTNIQDTFVYLGFDVKLAENLDASTLKKRMLDISKKDQSNNNMFICFVMSHGLPYSVYGNDGLPIDIKRLTDPFSATLCPSLAGKPKIFIIQACQGQKHHKAATDVCDQASITDASAERPSIPEYADILVGYSSINGFVSYRDPQHGSIYIRTLCETVKRFPELHIVDILTIVNREVSEMEFTVGSQEDAEVQRLEICKQMPMFESSLTKHAYLTDPTHIFRAPDTNIDLTGLDFQKDSSVETTRLMMT